MFVGIILAIGIMTLQLNTKKFMQFYPYIRVIGGSQYVVEIPESPARKDKKGSMDEEKHVKHSLRILLLHAHCQVVFSIFTSNVNFKIHIHTCSRWRWKHHS